MKFDDICNSILERVFHGTPHDIVGTFDIQKIGSGEGAQAYGWGLYFAESPNVAQDYRRGLSHKHLINKVKEVYGEMDSPEDAEAALKNAGLNDKEIIFIQALQKDDFLGFDYPHQAVNAALQEPQNFELSDETKTAIANMGNLYEVNILADKENDFLDWDMPISKKIKNLLINSGWTEKGLRVVRAVFGRTGSSLYSALEDDLGSKKAASENLLSAGIKGIKYLDQGSRGTGEGTYNYVIFDPKIIQIVSKNGEFVMGSKKPENVEI